MEANFNQTAAVASTAAFSGWHCYLSMCLISLRRVMRNIPAVQASCVPFYHALDGVGSRSTVAMSGPKLMRQ